MPFLVLVEKVICLFCALFGLVMSLPARTSNKASLEVVDSCRIFSKTGSDTFRSVLIYGKEEESRKKNFITVQKIFTFLRNTFS